MDDEKKIAEIRAAMSVDAQSFLSNFRDLSSKGEINAPSIDTSRKEDMMLTTLILLRGKTEEEYHFIVHGLFEAHDRAQGESEKEFLFNVINSVMTLGEINLGIDWS